MKSGRSLLLTCTLLEGKDVSFSWFKDGRLLKPGDRVRVLPTEESSVLSISRVSSQDSGSYACLANNGLAEEKIDKDVTVEGNLGN